MCEEEVLVIRQKLDKAVNDSDTSKTNVLDLLQVLQTLPITLDVLQRTRIGLSVNAVRKSSGANDDVANIAKQLIKSWKSLLDASKTNGKSSKINGGQSDMRRSNSAVSVASEQSSLDSSDVILSQASNSTRSAADGSIGNSLIAKAPPTVDEVRMKCREMLATALKIGDLPDGTNDPDDLAARIEQAIYEMHRNTGDKYKAGVRSRVFNLRDKRNFDLRINVLTGEIGAKRLARMTTEEMASSEMKKLREKLTKDAINEHQMAVDTGTPTDLFKCGKCHGYNCTYTQAQTRSADEPMTTFVWCQACGNRWKFS